MQPDVNIQSVYEEVLKNRAEIRNFIEAVEARLLIKLEEVHRRVTNLETENTYLKKQIEFLDRENRKNNIAIFGLKHPNDTLVNETFVCKELNRLLGVQLKEADIANVLPLGKREKCPLRIKLVNYQKKNIIFKNCSKLKGTKLSISNDLTIEQQKEHKILRKHLVLAKLDGHENAKIKGNNLIVDETSYSIEDLKKIEAADDDKKVNRNSAPPTPLRSETNDKHNQRQSRKPDEKKQDNTSKQICTEAKKTPTTIPGKVKSRYSTRSGSTSKK